MFKEFYINGDWWKIVFVNPWDKHLVDRTGEITLATSDYSEKIVFISESLNKELLTHVFLHELGHCIMFSCGLLFELHKMVKREFWIQAEEWVCNFIANYGCFAIKIARDVLGNDFICIEPAWDGANVA
ncbi:Uncharacterised protein [uncultured Eubacterium sp.]|jgi:hypothetical protein|nr:Uncharacterised protein [uncultured Eubacterium sp.]DAK62088.1 MAG TPA: PolyVal Metallopeptidase superfamily domain [Caudoviricetes sp.]